MNSEKFFTMFNGHSSEQDKTQHCCHCGQFVGDTAKNFLFLNSTGEPINAEDSFESHNNPGYFPVDPFCAKRAKLLGYVVYVHSDALMDHEVRPKNHLRLVVSNR